MSDIDWVEHFAPNQKWQATITRGGRWTWHINYTNGLTGLRSGALVTGSQRRAGKVARRKLARLNREDEHYANRRVIQ